ncbi:MAG: septation protein A [Pseudomonadota bacterium]
MSPWLKIVLEIGPLAVFFILFNQAKDPDGDAAQVDALIFATVGFIAALLASIAVTYALTRTVSRMLMATTVVVIVLGGLTVWLRDETFIKMRPTLVNGAFALLLGIGLLQGRSYLKTVIGDLLPMRDEGWMKLTRNWACYFAFMACLNEAVWRNVSTETWVDVKTFVYLPLALIFTLSQSGLIAKYQIEEKAKA